MRIKTASVAGGLLATAALLFTLTPAASATTTHDPRDDRNWGRSWHHNVHPSWNNYGFRNHRHGYRHRHHDFWQNRYGHRHHHHWPHWNRYRGW
ncbi:hypothetical protein OUY22_06460 [Nonomuraea sp. MCN248]|uniref:Uncharacterized protein n=1 Tax=Nonomuraea corallina TaxID=2989783 RepID=A0ABT4S758_9ACTN|nr:hypothetical protein [Nonomuraea corallina]MDA0633057.1 hypothetical protein [Nonomuraea corallina]